MAETLKVTELPAEGEIPCPDPACSGEVVEWDRGFRANRIRMQDGYAYAATGSDDWEAEEERWNCSTCCRPIEMPAGFEIEDYS
jgi:hypothetical protein